MIFNRLDVAEMVSDNFYKKIKNYLAKDYIVLIITALIIFVSITAKIELVQPLLILLIFFISVRYRQKIAYYSLIFSVLALTVQDLYNLHIEYRSFLIDILTIIIAGLFIIKSTNKLKSKNNQLKERVKELRGLFKISRLIDSPEMRLDDTLQEIIDIIPPAWQYSDDIGARIIYEEKEYKTENFKETNWCQESEIILEGNKKGKVQVCYLNKHPIEDRNSPFLEEEFELLDDISDRISKVIKSFNQEQKIKKNNKFLSITLDSIGDAIIVTDKKGKIVRMNHIAEELTGWTFNQAEGLDIKEVFKIINSQTGKPILDPINKVLSEGKAIELAKHTKLISKGGEKYHISDSAAPIKDGKGNIYGAVMVFRNFTDKYRLNQEVKRREKLFSTAIDELPHPVMIYSEDGSIKNVNDTWCEITGYRKEELKHTDDWFLKAYGEKRSEIKSYVNKLFDLDEKIYEGEFEILTADRDKRIWDFSTAPLGRDKDGKRLVLSMAVDITEKRELIDKINKLNRIYSIISNVNQAIVRNDNISDLFFKICNIVIESGKYKNVWIAKIDDDNLNIFSSAGKQSDLLDTINLNIKDPDSKNILDEACEINPDILLNYIKNKSNQEYKEFIYNNNKKSAAIFPLKVFDELWGVFCLCIDQGNYFDDKEINLFKELTNDLSFAVKSIKNEKRRKQTEEKLKKSEKKYRNLYQNAPVGIFKSNQKGELLLANPKLLKILGFTSIKEFHDYYSSLSGVYDNPVRRKQLFKKIREKKEVNNFIFKANKGDGSKIWISLNATISNVNGDGVVEIDGFLEDITEKYEMEQQLKRSEERYRLLFENQYAVMLIIHPESGKIIDANKAACEYYGFRYQQITDKNISEINILTKDDIKSKMNTAVQGEKHSFEFKHQLADGEIRDVEVYSGPIKLENKDYLLSIIHDITERKIVEREIKHITFHDKLTDLYNRAYLEEEMKRIDTKRQLPLSLIMGDLNNLKLVNDTYGHQKGDELIKRAADIIKSCCRDEDIIARWGGDEYVILLPNTTLKESEKICKRIFEKTEKQDKELMVSISLGSATKDNPQQDIYKVLNTAEDRMYKNKITNRKSARSSVLTAFLNTLREKSFETEEHASRMKELCFKLGKKVGLSSSDQDRLSLLTSLHDIGKITIPQEILNKPAKLTEEEWKKVKGHTEAGYRIVSNMDEFADIAEYILYHHESWDGGGYPEGLSKEDIPLLSRILAIVDAYDVMTRGRPYKKPITKKEAVKELKRCAGTQFDPNLVDKFIDIIRE